MSRLSPQTSSLAKGKENPLFLLFELSRVIDTLNFIHPASNHRKKPEQSDFSIPALML